MSSAPSKYQTEHTVPADTQIMHMSLQWTSVSACSATIRSGKVHAANWTPTYKDLNYHKHDIFKQCLEISVYLYNYQEPFKKKKFCLDIFDLF